MILLEVKGLCKSFGGLRAVFDLEFEVREGEIIGLIGPDGSGKTTSLNLISGCLRPDEDGTGNVHDPLIQWQDYEQVVVWPPELATHDLVFPAPLFEERD